MSSMLGAVLLSSSGAVAGSFIGAAALRSVRGEQVLLGRSRCDACGCSLTWRETVPLVAFVVRGGRCRTCSARIDLVHPLAEAVGASVAFAMALVSPWPVALATGVTTAALVAASVVDARTHRLPNVLTAVIAICSLTLAAFKGWFALGVGLLAAMLAGSMLLGVRAAFQRLRKEPSLGLGDVKLIGALAFWVGEYTAAMVAMAALLALGVHATSRRNDRLAFGPMLAASGLFFGVLTELSPWPR